jgi:Phosphotransferase enzyme family
MKATENFFYDTVFIQKLMVNYSGNKTIRVLSADKLLIDNSASILVSLTTGQTERTIGHFGLAVTYEENGLVKSKNMVMKVKPKGEEITTMLTSLAQACGGELAATYTAYKALTGFHYTHVREQEIYTKLPSKLTPTIFGVETDTINNRYVILMEYLQETVLLNSVMFPELFTDLHIKTALRQMAAWHARHYDRPLPVNAWYWDDQPSLSMMKNLSSVWEALVKNAVKNFPNLYTEKRAAYLFYAIQQIPEYWQVLSTLPKTLIHNDFNPRNICFKSEGSQLQLCVYDWELSTYHIPQYDVVEFLCFVLDKDRYHLRPYYLEYYRNALQELIPSFIDPEKFNDETELAALDFGLHRLGMYMMAHTVSPYPFLPRVVESYFNLLERSKYLSAIAS